MKDNCNCKNKKYCPLRRKCLSPNIAYLGKTTSIQPNYNDKVYFRVAKKSLKILKSQQIQIMQMPQTFQKNTGKLKGATLFRK